MLVNKYQIFGFLLQNKIPWLFWSFEEHYAYKSLRSPTYIWWCRRDWLPTLPKSGWVDIIMKWPFYFIRSFEKLQVLSSAWDEAGEEGRREPWPQEGPQQRLRGARGLGETGTTDFYFSLGLHKIIKYIH